MLNLPPSPQFCQTDVSGSTFVNADCFDVFPFIEDKSIDAIICDLPYGTTKLKWDSVLPLDKLWIEYNRVLKTNGVIVLFGAEPFSSVLRLSNIENYKYDWKWEKAKATLHALCKKRPMKSDEDICIFYKYQPTYNPQMSEGLKYKGRNNVKNHKELKDDWLIGQGSRSDNNGTRYPRTNVFFANENKVGQHPTQKPLELMEYLVKTYTNEGDTVLDNTMGSGTTNLACIKLNRKSIGIEKEKQYFDVAVRRASEYCH